MKVTMSNQGVLMVTPECGPEVVALRWWVNRNLLSANDIARDEQCHWRGSGLLVVDLPVVTAPDRTDAEPGTHLHLETKG